MPRTKEEVRESNKKYREANKEKIKEYNKKYIEKNKEKILEKQKEYRHTPKGKKSQSIHSWKQYGIICDYEAIYDIYINTHKCEYCNKEFKLARDRCLDHNHNTGEVRGILCRSCNVKDVFK